MLFELALLTALTFQAVPAPAETTASFHVVVHRSNPVSSFSRSDLSLIFMRRVQRWPDGSLILPIDQLARSSVRERFSREIHRKSVEFVIRYWHRVIFAGRGLPPREASSDAAVLELVKMERAAIGYISVDTSPGEDVKVIKVTR